MMDSIRKSNEAVKQIIGDMRALGIRPDDTVLVHSSLKSLGWVDGGAETVIQALIASLPEGTLLMPALSFIYVNAENPRFSAVNTPCCVGTIPEAFRTYPGVVRSIHPTHSVCAYGVHAEKITSRHYLDRTPVGENSPFRLLAGYRGKILMLGCGLEPNTFMHGAEENAGLPYVLQDMPTRIFIEDKDGSAEETFYYMHDFNGIIQRYDRITDCMDIGSGKILEAEALVLDVCTLWEAVSKTLSIDPWFFVDNE